MQPPTTMMKIEVFLSYSVLDELHSGGRGLLDISLGGEVRPGPAPHTLTLFKTEFRFLIPCLRYLTRNHTLCKTIININFAVGRLFIVQEKIPCLRQKLIKSIP